MHRFSLALLVVACAAGCSPEQSPSSQTSANAPNILLISLDALRADHLSCYGYDRHTTPFLDELAARGTRFSQAFVNTHGTPPSHTTMLSSLYQESHRVGFGAGTPEGRNDTIPAEVELVQEILQTAGWRTVAVTGGGYMAATFGFDRGFDEFRGGSAPIAEGTRKLLNLLRQAPAKPTFALLHTYEVHSPYEPPPEYEKLWNIYESSLPATNEVLKPLQKTAGEQLTEADFNRLEALYDAGIRYTDDVLRSFFAELESIGFLDHALVIITADHGEEFGDHGGLLHGMSLYEELLHVPLILVGSETAAARVDPRLVSMVDLAPTILKYAGLAVPGHMEGRNLLSDDWSLPWHEQRIFAQYADFRYAVRTPRWKLIQYPRGNRTHLFDLKRDPSERHNLRHERPELAAALEAELDAWRAGRPAIIDQRGAQDELPQEKIDELRALGYVD